MGVQASALKWGPAPPGLPPGARVAVVSGNPGGDGPYVVRAKLPTGYKVMPHTHPTDENVTVLSGVFHIAMGDKFDTKKGDALKAGGFVNAQKGMLLIHLAISIFALTLLGLAVSLSGA